MATTRRLYVLRHAKSSWDDPFLSDAERPLAARGKAASQALRHHFEEIRLRVDLVLCSTARRARDTWAGVCDGVGGDPEVRFLGAIYGATATQLIDLLHTVDGGTSAVLLIGHNPGLEDLVGRLGGRDAGPMPTGGFATLNVEGDWAELQPGKVSLHSVVRPRELAG